MQRGLNLFSSLPVNRLKVTTLIFLWSHLGYIEYDSEKKLIRGSKYCKTNYSLLYLLLHKVIGNLLFLALDNKNYQKPCKSAFLFNVRNPVRDDIILTAACYQRLAENLALKLNFFVK